ncbi:hypothetical protein GALL_483400 [mine drainage metagenome]|uniref:Uncharacterized protein n=1 Tax=mine drainage metagenome TaxID=410659 RepID=A0A1J5PR46_9ZZZZ
MAGYAVQRSGLLPHQDVHAIGIALDGRGQGLGVHRETEREPWPLGRIGVLARNDLGLVLAGVFVAELLAVDDHSLGQALGLWDADDVIATDVDRITSPACGQASRPVHIAHQQVEHQHRHAVVITVGVFDHAAIHGAGNLAAMVGEFARHVHDALRLDAANGSVLLDGVFFGRLLEQAEG